MILPGANSAIHPLFPAQIRTRYDLRSFDSTRRAPCWGARNCRHRDTDCLRWGQASSVDTVHHHRDNHQFEQRARAVAHGKGRPHAAGRTQLLYPDDPGPASADRDPRPKQPLGRPARLGRHASGFGGIHVVNLAGHPNLRDTRAGVRRGRLSARPGPVVGPEVPVGGASGGAVFEPRGCAADPLSVVVHKGEGSKSW